MTAFTSPLLCALATIVLVVPSFATAEPMGSARPSIDATDGELVEKLRSAPGPVRLHGLDPKLSALDLAPVRIFSHDARILVHEDEGRRQIPLGDLKYFRGEVVGAPGSTAILSLADDGSIHGFVVDGARRWLLERGGTRGGEVRPRLRARVFEEAWEMEPAQPFDCDAAALPAPASSLDGFAVSGMESTSGDSTTEESAAAGSTTTFHTARVAVETDWELRQKFASAEDLVRYVGDLFNYSSSVYEQEVATNLLVTTVSVWETSKDPWQQTATACGLLEFGRYWNDNRDDETRTIAHFLSGKRNGGGIAWRGVLCGGEFSPGLYGSGPSAFGCTGLTPENDNYGGAYGYTGNLYGTFDIDDPSVMWDIVAVAHEIGHNFDSRHTHDYCGVGGNSDPVDRCYSGCAGGAQGTPGPEGSGSGTLMSYCHLQSGGYSNLSMTFGTDHPYGVDPQRVPGVMRNHVLSRAESFPSCLAPDEVLFKDSFESGSTGRWGG